MTAKHEAGGALPGLIVLVVGLGAALLIAFGAGHSALQSSAPKAPPKPPDVGAAARAACAIFLERTSREPASFEAIEQWNWSTARNDDGTWSVLAHYRGRNGFGGVNVEKTACVMRQAGDNWTLISRARWQ